jgi:cystathionine gamma-lyase
MLKVLDLPQLAEFARKRGIRLAVDNTFATPILQRPLELGAHLVMHSATKYLNGHSDIVGGMIVVGDDTELAEKMTFLQNAVGGVQGPFDSFLALRGLKTLHLRMKAHCENAMQLAQWLETHPNVEKVIYPGLKSHPHHALATKQMAGYGGMMSILVRGGFADVNQNGLTVLAERALPEEELTQDILDQEILTAEMHYDATNEPAAKHAAESAIAQLREAKAALNF